MLDALRTQGDVIFTGEAFSGNQVFSQVLKETKNTTTKTHVADRAVRPREAKFGKLAARPAGERQPQQQQQQQQ